MKTYIDHSLVHADEALLVSTCEKAGISRVTFSLASLFEYLNLGSLFKNYPAFNDQHPLFALFISTLNDSCDQALLTHLFDQLFILCLTDVKALKEVNAQFLLSQIQKKKPIALFCESLNQYEKLLSDDPHHAIHDLTLYLAFDRISVALAYLFEHAAKHSSGLKVLRDCLIESFQHITLKGTARPSFFRLIETLYADDMRDENLDSYTEAEWLALCQSSCALRPREQLIDVPYIDEALNLDGLEEKIIVITADSEEKVQASLSFANFMIAKLGNYRLNPVEIIYL